MSRKYWLWLRVRQTLWRNLFTNGVSWTFWFFPKCELYKKYWRTAKMENKPTQSRYQSNTESFTICFFDPSLIGSPLLSYIRDSLFHKVVIVENIFCWKRFNAISCIAIDSQTCLYLSDSMCLDHYHMTWTGRLWT